MLLLVGLGDLHGHAGVRPLFHDLAVPVDVEPALEALCDNAAHAVGLREVLHRRRAQSLHRAIARGQRTRGDRTNMADGQGDEDAPEICVPGGLQVL